MSQIKKQWDILSEEERRNHINKIITFFSEERSEEIGVIAAEEVLDFFLENFTKPIYNKGIEEVKEMFKEKMTDLEVDLDAMKQKTDS
ncbi:MAG: hypothetical protein ACD_18C00280G0008 [uncultured bacterium]|nr:MAG: hypothetical protein ACD_18C00280G0008 [uncultured bacterium]OGH84844.1 MAG: hypothetical protein A2488_00385 [Candidatus Magasanikbacteria bacterium RIFOXYC12_FULL_32_21b]OGH91065.1 MAG: hypothetical protein A2507_02895 [Candidatus Magasanikbacteria bacterium RIFOXYD12_FULL_33_17]HAO52774.1 DUF2164 domain-containing protein [Candidatus Magasanikbacteria bacterium]